MRIKWLQLLHPSSGATAPALSYRVSCLKLALICATSFQSWYCNKLAASVWILSSNLFLVLPTRRLPEMFTLRACLGIQSRESLCSWPAYWSLLNLTPTTDFGNFIYATSIPFVFIRSISFSDCHNYMFKTRMAITL